MCGKRSERDSGSARALGLTLVTDHVYLVCEPPGEPYYLGRIMDFLHAQNDRTKPVEALRINWFYRPKDIGKKGNDTRLLVASMHSDVSPLTSLRGKCEVRHKAEIDNIDEYRQMPDCFWFEKLYDRYIQKYYEVVPSFQIVNVPDRVKKVLDERWKYILVEQGKSKEFTSAAKLCKKCGGYCARWVLVPFSLASFITRPSHPSHPSPGQVPGTCMRAMPCRDPLFFQRQSVLCPGGPWKETWPN